MTGEIAAKVSVARLASVRFLFLLGLGLLSSIRIASAQVELKAYANADGYIDVQKLTCGQLANTFQEDADSEFGTAAGITGLRRSMRSLCLG